MKNVEKSRKFIKKDKIFENIKRKKNFLPFSSVFPEAIIFHVNPQIHLYKIYSTNYNTSTDIIIIKERVDDAQNKPEYEGRYIDRTAQTSVTCVHVSSARKRTRYFKCKCILRVLSRILQRSFYRASYTRKQKKKRKNNCKKHRA